MYGLARRIGFRLDAERAHRLGLRAARLGRPLSLLRARRHAERPVEVFGLRFANPLGLAAGYDKDGRAWRGLAAMGFGHVEIGTVTPRPQSGNPRPRLTRLPESEALVNSLGFPSDGADAVSARIVGRRPAAVVLGVSIGPNADTPPERRIDDYRSLIERFAGPADYLAVNVSSPNTAGLRELQRPEALTALLAALCERRDALSHRAGRTPLLVKVSPDVDDVAAVARSAQGAGADGLIVCNTTTRREGGTEDAPAGGLSGAPLRSIAVARLAEVVAASHLPVVASGGVMTAADVEERLAIGAHLVQVYTGLVYRGPRLVHEVLDRRS